jgi:hypothetical protein
MASWPRLAWLPYTVKASVEAVPTRGIRSNCDYPRPIATPALATLLGGDGRPESYLDFFSTGSNDLTQIGDQTAWFSASSPPPYVESREVGAREVLQRRGTAACIRETRRARAHPALRHPRRRRRKRPRARVWVASQIPKIAEEVVPSTALPSGHGPRRMGRRPPLARSDRARSASAGRTRARSGRPRPPRSDRAGRNRQRRGPWAGLFAMSSASRLRWQRRWSSQVRPCPH